MTMAILELYADIIEAQNSDLSTAVREIYVALQIAAQSEPQYRLESWVWALLYKQTSPLEFFQQAVQIPPSQDLYERVFYLLLIGNPAQASDECANAKDWSLKSAIESENNELLKKACGLLAKNSELPRFQRGVYGLLSGDLQSTVPLCSSWEAECVVRLSSAKINNQSSKVQFQALQYPSQYRILEAILGGTLEAYLQAQAKSWLDDSIDSEEDLDLLRINAHLSIVTQASNTESLLHAYIETLMGSGFLMKTPAYIRFLPSKLQPNVYSSVLLRVDAGDIPNDAHRALQVALSNRYNLDIAGAALEAVQIKLEDYLSQPQQSQSLVALKDIPAVTEAEMEVTSALKWLETVGNWDALVHHSLELIRFWLVNGRLPAVLFAGRWLPLSNGVSLCMDPKLRQECAELKQHLLLIDFFNLVETSPRDALARVLPFEQYLSGLANNAPRQIYVPYGITELVRALDEPCLIMDVAVRVASIPQLTALFVETSKLNQLMDLFATSVKTSFLD